MIPDQPPMIPTQAPITPIKILLITTRGTSQYTNFPLTPPHPRHPSAVTPNKPPGKPITMIDPVSPFLHDYKNMTNYISDSEESNPKQALHPNPTIGDTLMLTTSATLRIMFQNVNGINLDKDGGDFHSICKRYKNN